MKGGVGQAIGWGSRTVPSDCGGIQVGSNGTDG
jgi:hypothetical protein